MADKIENRPALRAGDHRLVDAGIAESTNSHVTGSLASTRTVGEVDHAPQSRRKHPEYPGFSFVSPIPETRGPSGGAT